MEESEILHICNVNNSEYAKQIQSEIESNNPVKTIVHWNIDIYEQLINKHYPELKDLFDNFEFKLQKALVGRLAALHKYGGLLISNSMRPTKNIDKFIESAFTGTGSYINFGKSTTILFEHLPFDFDENERLSMDVIMCKKSSNFIRFCIDSVIKNPIPVISEAETISLSLKNVYHQAEIIDRQCGSRFLNDCLKKYLSQRNSFDVSVLPYYYINPCSSTALYDQSVFIFNGPVDETQRKMASRHWTPLKESAFADKKFVNCFMQDTEPARKTEDLIKTKVAVIAWQFPNRANTFVMNEVMEMHKRGVDLTIYSMSFPTAECRIIYKDELEKIGDKIICVPQNRLINHKKIWEDRIAFFQNEFRLNLNLCKTIDPTLENFNQQEQECVQNSAGFLEKFIEDIEYRGIEKIYAPFANGDTEIAMMLSHHTGIPYYFTAHAYDLFSSYHYARMKAKTVTHAFAISEYNKNYMIKELGIPKEKITVRRINILKPDSENVFKKEIGTDFIFSAGRLDEMKGFKYSIEAFNSFHKQYPDVHYVIVGTGILEPELKELVSSLKLENFVHFVGHVKNSKVLEFAKGAVFSILSSIEMPNKDKEGLPTCFVESMSLGTPCIGTNYSGTPELIDHEENGMLTAEKDVEDIAEKMKKLYDMVKSDENKIYWACKNKVNKMFDNQKNIALLLEHLK